MNIAYRLWSIRRWFRYRWLRFRVSRIKYPPFARVPETVLVTAGDYNELVHAFTVLNEVLDSCIHELGGTTWAEKQAEKQEPPHPAQQPQ